MLKIKPISINFLKAILEKVIQDRIDSYKKFREIRLNTDPMGFALTNTFYGGVDLTDKILTDAQEWLNILEFVDTGPVSPKITEIPEKYLHVLAQFSHLEEPKESDNA